MTFSQIFDVHHQLAFYGAYHSNRINVLIHLICVPLLFWTFQILASAIPVPSFIPSYRYAFNEYLAFDLNASAIHAGIYIMYYFTLEPLAALLYVPQLLLMLLTATAFSQRPNAIVQASLLHAASWVAQFLGHGLAEKRAPALLDNLLGAVVLAPFFAHLEILFGLGYKPEFHKRINNEIAKEITRRSGKKEAKKR